MKANENVKINREYKDRLFRFIFGSPENKHYLLSLYNAVNGSDYDNIDDIEITTLDDVIYIKQKNDVSFLLDSELSLYEEQSSYNPNMPLRGFMYFADLYRVTLSGRKQDLYNSSLLKIPTPKHIVFYAGTKEVDDIVELKMSDAFEHAVEPGSYEWTAIMYNINAGHNKELLEKCKALREYSSYIAMVRQFSKDMPIEEAVDKAVAEAIKQNYFDGYIKKHAEGVKDMSLTEYNEEEFIENRREEGRVEGALETLISLVKDGLLSLQEAAKRAGMTEADFKSRC